MKDKIARNTFIVFVIIIIGKVISFFRDIFITYFFGASSQTDAYFMANNIPSLLYTALISSLLAMFIPLYKEEQVKKGTLAADIYASKTINLIVVLTILLTIIGFFVQEPLVNILANGFSESQKKLTIKMCNVLLLSFPISSVSLLLANISNANKKFYSIHIIPIISSVIVIGALFFFHTYGIFSLIYSSVVGFVIQLIVQLLIAKDSFHYKRVSIFSTRSKYLIVVSFPVFLAYAMDQINLVINSSLSTYLQEGNISIYSYAMRLQGTFISTISLAFVTVVYPLMSELFYKKDFVEFRTMIKRGLKFILYITLPVAIFLSFNARYIVDFIFGRGAFNYQDVEATSSVFSVAILNLIFLSLRDLMLRIFFVKKQLIFPTLSSVIFFFVNLGLGMAFLHKFHLIGLAYAYLIASTVSVIFLFIKLKFDLKLNIKLFYFIDVIVLSFFPFIVFQFMHFFPSNLFTLLLQFLIMSILSLGYLYYRKEELIVRYVIIIKNKCQYLKTKHY